MFDENDRSSHPDDTSRHIRRGARHEDDKTIEVDSSAFFAPEVPCLLYTSDAADD